MPVVVGIDTSNYTTSVSVVDFNENLISDNRKILEVKNGERGLRQSEAVFQHLINLPELIKDSLSKIGTDEISAISVSVSPRPAEGSYMPVFTAARSFGSVMADTLKVPLIEASHQEGHIRAGIWSAKGPIDECFAAIHLSGGTTEFVKINKKNSGFNIGILGSTLDISAGQLIDRLGVEMGLKFPCGKELETLASKGSDVILAPSIVKDFNVSFSGTETKLMRLVGQARSEDLAFAAQKCISKTLQKVFLNIYEKLGLSKILIVGGVASNKFIRNYLTQKLPQFELFFAQPEYSVDNSVGTALMGVDYAKANFNSK